jgi:hypothetical protein
MCSSICRTYKCKHSHAELAPCDGAIAGGGCRRTGATLAMLQVHSTGPCAACAPAYQKWAELQAEEDRRRGIARNMRELEDERVLGEKLRGLFEPDASLLRG